MRILAIGDFHGKSPHINKIIKKEKIDLVLSTGDFFPFSYRKIWFKYSYRTGISLSEIIGKNKLKELILKDLNSGEKVLKELNNLNIPVLTTFGNADYSIISDSSDFKKSEWKWENQDFFSKIIEKYPKIKRIDYSYQIVDDYIFIGSSGSSFPGHVKSKNYKKYKAKLEKIFEKFKKKKIIFLFHNMPYKTKLDKIKDKNAEKIVYNKHYGSKMIKRIIEKYHPVLGIGGHFHENQGKDKIKKTIIVNTGSAADNKYAVIDLNKKIKIKFKKK